MLAPNTQIHHIVSDEPRFVIGADIRIAEGYENDVLEHLDLIEAIGGKIISDEDDGSLEIVYNYDHKGPSFDSRAFKDFFGKLKLILPEEALADVVLDYAGEVKNPEVFHRYFKQERIKLGLPDDNPFKSCLNEKDLFYELPNELYAHFTFGKNPNDSDYQLYGSCGAICFPDHAGSFLVTDLQIDQMIRFIERSRSKALHMARDSFAKDENNFPAK